MAKRILVVDDEPAVREVFYWALTDAGYEVETAATGEDGLRKARAAVPDLVFLDLRMPGMDGIETLRRLRQCCEQVPVYIVTAFRKDYLQSLRQAASEGFRFQVADKPLAIEQIKAIVVGALEGAQAYDAPE